jgi:hypothetical protein
VREAVQKGADDRGEQRERSHRDREVQGHSATGLVRRDREEDRRGERHGDHHVPGAVHPVQLDQLAEP